MENETDPNFNFVIYEDEKKEVSNVKYINDNDTTNVDPDFNFVIYED